MTTDLMGRVVLVHKIFKRDYVAQSTGYCHNVGWKSTQAEGRPGWVVGERWLQEGTLCSSQFNEEAIPTWERKDGVAIHCILVCYWPTTKPVRVPLDGYELALDTIKPYPPVDYPWAPADRERVSKEMKAWPRDAKGRWVRKA